MSNHLSSDADTPGLRRFALVRRGTMWLAPLVLIAVVLVAWEVTIDLANVPSYLLPPPSAVAGVLVSDTAILWDNVRITVVEIVCGYGLALIASLLLGSALAYSSVFRRTAMPLVIAWKTIPTIAISPLLIIWFGYDVGPKLLITALVCFFPMTVNTADGLLSVDSERRRMFRVMGASAWSRFSKLDLPTALPHVLTGMKIAVPLAVVGATISEWVGASSGLGHLILNDIELLDTTRVFAAIALLSSIGITLYGLVVLFEYLSTGWRRQSFSTRRRWSTR